MPATICAQVAVTPTLVARPFDMPIIKPRDGAYIEKVNKPCGFKNINKNHIIIGPIKNKVSTLILCFIFIWITNIAIQKGPIQNVEMRKDIV